jgi:ABC-type sugar transport system ATPase subunit
MPTPQASPIVLELAGVSKTFGGVEALRKVDFALSRG